MVAADLGQHPVAQLVDPAIPAPHGGIIAVMGQDRGQRRADGGPAHGFGMGENILIGLFDPAQEARLALVTDDVMSAATPLQDIVLAMNFSYWIFKERGTLRRYFKRVRENLVDDGVFYLDCYGGYDAFRELKEKTKHKHFTYVWDQASYNPINGHMVCHIHFQFPDKSRLNKAFTYEWRLWTMPELREILSEAGFDRTVVYQQPWIDDDEEELGDFEAVESAEADAGWIAYIAACK